MPFFAQATIDRVIANPDQIAVVYAAARGSFISYIESRGGVQFRDLPEDYIKLMFTSLFIHTAKPYGSGNNGQPLEVLLASPTLDCSTYCDAALWLYQKLSPSDDSDAAHVGWGAGPIGGHAQLFIKGVDGPGMLLDPTAMTFAVVRDFEDIVSGVPVARTDQLRLGWRAETATFSAKLTDVLEDGTMRGGQISYWVDDPLGRVYVYGASQYLPTPLRETIENRALGVTPITNNQGLGLAAQINAVTIDPRVMANAGSSASDVINGSDGNDIIVGGAMRDVESALMSVRDRSFANSFIPALLLEDLRSGAVEIGDIYMAFEARFKAFLGKAFSTLPEHHIKLAFASTIVHDLATLGPTKITDYAPALAAGEMNAESQSVLAWRFFRDLTPEVDYEEPTSGPDVVMLVWDGDNIGHRSQLMISKVGTKSLIVDTASGHIALADSYNALVGGDRAVIGEQRSTYWRGDIDSYVEQAWTGFDEGLYRTGNLLTWFEEPTDYWLWDYFPRWATPQGDPYRIGTDQSLAIGETSATDRISGGLGADTLVGDGATVNAGTWMNAGTATTGNWLVGDFNGDGRGDMLRYQFVGSHAEVFVSDGDGFRTGRSWTDWGAGHHGWRIGDFNGDGRDDLLRMPLRGAQAEVLLSTGTGFVLDGLWTTNGSAGNPFEVGDFNGDGKTDLLRWNASMSIVQVMLSDGDRFGVAVTWSLETPGLGRWRIGDFNGDGRDDLFAIGTGGEARVLLSNGAGFEASTVWTTEAAGADGWTFADLNGDGALDLVGTDPSHPKLSRVLLSNGADGFGDPSDWVPINRSTTAVYAGDFDGDGRDDLAAASIATGQRMFDVHLGNADHAGERDIFVLRRGEIGGDVILDFRGASLGGEDRIQFEGFGDGRKVSVVIDGDNVTITGADRKNPETFKILGLDMLEARIDYYFVT
jgi:FG-GAP-like repeat/RTX calcium-binding nonapeptide repeat (4 copies)